MSTYAECRYAGCRYTKGHGAVANTVSGAFAMKGLRNLTASRRSNRRCWPTFLLATLDIFSLTLAIVSTPSPTLTSPTSFSAPFVAKSV